MVCSRAGVAGGGRAVGRVGGSHWCSRSGGGRVAVIAVAVAVAALVATVVAARPVQLVPRCGRCRRDGQRDGARQPVRSVDRWCRRPGVLGRAGGTTRRSRSGRRCGSSGTVSRRASASGRWCSPTRSRWSVHRPRSSRPATARAPRCWRRRPPCPAPAVQLLPGLAVGDTSRVGPALDRAMQVASLTHLTAVSGANCAIVVGLVMVVLRRLPLAARVGAARSSRWRRSSCWSPRSRVCSARR